MKCASCDTEISQSNPKLCPYCGSRNLVSSEQAESPSSNNMILLESKLAILFKDRFVYKGETYPISSMKSASMDSGFFVEPELTIKFENGQFKHFMVGTMSGESQLNSLLTGGMVDTVSSDLRMSTQQWATTINMLITMR